FDACAGTAAGALVIDFTVYSKGAVDRAAILYDDDAIDEGCVIDIVRTLAFADRGKEPPTRFVLRLARGKSDVLPLAVVQRALDAQAFSIARCMNEGGADAHAARAVAVRFDVDAEGHAGNIQVSSAE